jgi:hypothetical protein
VAEVIVEGDRTVQSGARAILPVVSRFEPKYSAEQRACIVRAYDDRRIRPARRIVEMARSGRLRGLDGRALPPFDVPEDSVRSMARAARRARAGEIRSKLEHENPRDVVEILRVRLIRAADAVLQEQQRLPPGKRNLEVIRQVARVVREIASLPEPWEPRPPAPGAKINGQRIGGETRGGLAGALLKAHRTW